MVMMRRRFWLLRLPALVWAICIFIALALPGDDVPSVHFWTFGIEFDKFMHGALFFGQALLLYPALLTSRRDSFLHTHALALSTALSIVYGGFMEFVQMAVPNRSADPLDFVADGAGAAIFVFVCAFGLKKVIAAWARYGSADIR
jgi:VanZ family protein